MNVCLWAVTPDGYLYWSTAALVTGADLRIQEESPLFLEAAGEHNERIQHEALRRSHAQHLERLRAAFAGGVL